MTGSSETNNSNNNNWIVPVLISSGMSVAAVLCGYWAVEQHEKYLRSKWLDEEDQKQLLQQKENNTDSDNNSTDSEADTNIGLHSVIGHFRSLELGAQSTILEANRRRTTSYYEKAREAHEQSLVLGVPSYSDLLKKRKKVLDDLLFNHREGKRSLRTVIVMLDGLTQTVLSEARQKILQPLNYSWDIYHKGVWIPEINMIPNEDMHVTVACPWWWHTMREGNHELNNDLTIRLKQALVIGFHHPFFLELERFVLLGGKTLVALWRTVGDRLVDTEHGSSVVCDRHATTIDPMVRLRREIVDCFTNDQHEHKLRPLTHQHLKEESTNTATATATTIASDNSQEAPPPLPQPQKMVRTHTIESKTPGLGSGDGFIHTTLFRLPLECFSSKDVELEPIHRLCREATATYSGHRMLIHRFRFVETTGEGGDSNPCKNPRFDTTLEAPLRANNGPEGTMMFSGTGRCHSGSNGNSNSSSGNNSNNNSNRSVERPPDMTQLERRALTTGRAAGISNPGGIKGLFDPPKSGADADDGK